MLDTTKTSLDVFEETRKLLEKAPEPEKPEQDKERARATPELMRSFVPVVFAELLLWMFRGVFLLGLLRVYLEFYCIRKASEK